MKSIAERGSRKVWLVEISPAGDFDLPDGLPPFALMLVDFAESLPDGTMERVSRAMISKGCRHASCAKERCGQWEDAFDGADMEGNPTLADDRFVVTAKHPGESLQEVLEFLFDCARIQERIPDAFVVAALGASAKDIAEIEETAARVLKESPWP